ncbi:MAG: tRNA (N(6)-L-threonylcarbamoyladenosine(37)-C(2))-methylthiotransferase MtaB [Epsilonproteobacteria bacterium]|nr:tRNA (N(6)-L-threonylcarbamoyladenosine(37)-C(2))-methylthiotransferase MtaB [Campylobacterota bacterium]NPA56240.1 tRNA (N(6)-L-threonylcarbamoyladenosine(37)-C(2))-methylthiotransferase MtaB [Campylobacterota bacterium]
MKVFFKTFGCRTNLFDTQIMVSRLREFTVTEKEDDADIVVVNSCTVTNGADSSVRNYINRIQRKGKKVYLTGCGAFTKGEELLAQGKVAAVFGHSEKERINELLKREGYFELGDLDHIDRTVVTHFVGRSRAFIKVQEGCDFDCSYCIIPSVRGRARSLDEGLIVEQVRTLAANGFGEFILTGTNVGSYGRDRGSSLAKLMKRLSLIRGVRRIRIGSLEPVQIDQEFRELLGERWLAKHLHIAIQHSSNRMLEIMGRRNRVEEDLELFHEIGERGFALGTDFIVGHPGESEEIFREALAHLREFPLTHIHLFTYSRRDGTRSASMGDPVNGRIARERYREIKEIVAQKNMAFRLSRREPLEVVVESRRKGGDYFGYDQFFNPVRIESSLDLAGNWVRVEQYEVREEANVARF